MGDKELGSIGIRSGIGHRDNLTLMDQGIAYQFILKAVSRAAPAGSCWISSLDHEIFYHSMESDPIIKTFLDQEQEIVHCLGGMFRIEFQEYITPGGFKFHSIYFVHINKHPRWSIPLFGHDSSLC